MPAHAQDDDLVGKMSSSDSAEQTIDHRIIDKLCNRAALLAGKSPQLRKTWRQVHSSAVRACRASDIESQFHVGKRLAQLSARYPSDHRAAFRANDFRLISAHDAVQATAAARIPKVFMWKGGLYFLLFRHSVTRSCEANQR
jgi:hypothetical protein